MYDIVGWRRSEGGEGWGWVGGRFINGVGVIIPIFQYYLLNLNNQIILQIWEARMSFMDDFIHRLNMIPPEADSLLRHIRQLDKEVQSLKLQLDPARELLLENLASSRKKHGKARSSLDQAFRQILKLQNEVEGKSKEKVATAQRLYNLIHQPTERLQKQLRQRGLDKNFQEDGGFKKKRGKKPVRKGLKRSEWQVDTNQPRYCYCGGLSFGQMVMCENTYCGGEWFHLGCINEKKLPQKWFCKNCRGKDSSSPKKTKNT